MKYSAFPPAEVRALIRAGKLDAPDYRLLRRLCPKVTWVVLPKALGIRDFLLFCQRNRQGLPPAGKLADAGERSFSAIRRRAAISRRTSRATALTKMVN